MASKNSVSPDRKSGKIRLSARARPRDVSPMLWAPAPERVTPMHSSDASRFDTIVVGSGPAGASCALWLKMLGYHPCIIEESSALGGLQAASPYINSWIATSMGKTGLELAQEFRRNVLSNDVDCFFGQCVQKIERIGGGFRVETDSGMSVAARTVVVATGVRSVTGGFSASENIIIGPGKRLASQDFTGARVAILGGGDSAFENYLTARAAGAAAVTIFARSIRARPELVRHVPSSDVVIGPYLVDETQAQINSKKFDKIVVLYGWEASLPFANSLIPIRNTKGFVITDEQRRTKIDGVYAIGEVTQHMHPCCVTSVADGVVAAKSIQRRLECDWVSQNLYPAVSQRAPDPQHAEFW
jgi:thioredoxin reductase (NADPH)